MLPGSDAAAAAVCFCGRLRADIRALQAATRVKYIKVLWQVMVEILRCSEMHSEMHEQIIQTLRKRVPSYYTHVHVLVLSKYLMHT